MDANSPCQLTYSPCPTHSLRPGRSRHGICGIDAGSVSLNSHNNLRVRKKCGTMCNPSETSCTQCFELWDHL